MGEINGRVIRATTQTFAFGSRVPRNNVLAFGALVKTRIHYKDATVFGLIYDIIVHDDGLTRMLSVAEESLVAANQVELGNNLQLPIEVSVLCVGYREGDSGHNFIRQAIPPQPPMTLQNVEICSADEIRLFTQSLDFFRLVLEARDLPCDNLLAACIELAAETHPDPRAFVLRSGRELARLLVNDALRLDRILRKLTDRTRGMQYLK